MSETTTTRAAAQAETAPVAEPVKPAEQEARDWLFKQLQEFFGSERRREIGRGDREVFEILLLINPPGPK